MQISRLKVQGFRSLHTEPAAVPLGSAANTSFESSPGVQFTFDPLTVLIGPNDCGKSSLLDILELVLSDGQPDAEDFHRPLPSLVHNEGVPSSNAVDWIEVTIEFKMHPTRDALASQFTLNGTVTYRVVLTAYSAEKYYLSQLPHDRRLRQDFAKMKAPDQVAFIQELDPLALASLSNIPERAEWLALYAAKAPAVIDWQPVPKGFNSILPRFERYSAMDYGDPASLVLKTLRQVYESVIFEEVEQGGAVTRRPIEPLRTIHGQVEQRINQEVQQLLDYIKRYNQRILSISYDPTIDFSGGLRAGQFQIDDGHGLRYLSKVGDGTKRRMFIAVVDWDREVTLSQTTEQSQLPSIIRGYDEPDTNLDYSAQRRMYLSISEIVGAPSSRVQAVVCTHSPRLVDQAPARSIRLLAWQDGRTNVSSLRTDDDPEIERFLSSFAREIGLTNTLMFYERCFVLVEGRTEENALPLLYRTQYQHSLLEDGIRIINVESNGAIREFLRLMSKNRQDLTLVLADLDTEKAQKGPKLTRQILDESQFSEDFVRTHLHLIPGKIIGDNGTEFEAAFPDQLIARALQIGWPKREGEWVADDVARLRATPNCKFSDRLKSAVWQQSQESFMPWSKPAFGSILGRECILAEMPQEIVDLFNHARVIAEAV
ncbi:MAG: AAA family ATPase [Deltaproteobacteria bacterium]